MSEFLKGLQWVSIDFETTGLNPWQHEILEVGCVRFTLESIIEEFQLLIKPQRKHDPRARAIHNITNEEIEEKGLDCQTAITQLMNFIGTESLVFHNAPFDVSFLVRTLTTLGMTIPSNVYFDNLFLSRHYFPERKSHSLSNIRKYLKLDESDQHRALSDARATALSFMDTLQKKGEGVTSANKYGKFMKYRRKLTNFKLKFPQNFEAIERFFASKIRLKELMKVQHTWEGEYKPSSFFFKPLEIMVFNQRVFIKGAIQGEAEEKLIPIMDAHFFDSNTGEIDFKNKR